jgi:hypothetical protein
MKLENTFGLHMQVFGTVNQLLKATKLCRVELVQGGWTTLYHSAIETKGFLVVLSK